MDGSEQPFDAERTFLNRVITNLHNARSLVRDQTLWAGRKIFRQFFHLHYHANRQVRLRYMCCFR